ncbi:hypothetical protein L1049_028505 [Liquidambar formosana]|uniref:Uncharacterized protein n=1 Tax=Liquidambar formosana TaxID=63359 RepID=A0AAP0RIZ6_LIQFO
MTGKKITKRMNKLIQEEWLVKKASSQTIDNQGGSSVPVKVKLPESVGIAKAADDSLVKKLENAASSFAEVSATPKDSSLIQKIEGLNAKARASDGRYDASSSVSSREEQRNRLHTNAKGVHSTNEASVGAIYFERTRTSGIHTPASYEVGVSTGDNSLEPAASSGTAIPRITTHGVQGRVDHRGKGRFNAQEADGWRKKSLVADSSILVSAANSESSNVHQDNHTSVEASEKSVSCLEGKDEGEFATSMVDPSDIQAQRAKMREIAKQRVKQRQKEEEERTREQTAKARAKLEELNRRTQALEGSAQNLENVAPSGSIPHTPKQEESGTLAEPMTSTSKVGAQNLALVSNTNLADQNNESSTSRVGESTILSREPPLETPKNAFQESVVAHNKSLALQQDVNIADAMKIAPPYPDSSVSKQKRMGYKQKPTVPLEKSLAEKSTNSTTEAQKSHDNVVVNVPASAELVANEIASSCESSLPINPDVTAESSVHQKKKNYRSGKNKHKLEEVSTAAAGLPSPVPKEANFAKAFVEIGKPKASEFELDPSSVQPLTSSKEAIQSSEQRLSLPSEETQGRVNNQWKSQNPRRLPRNQQVNRSGGEIPWR